MMTGTEREAFALRVMDEVRRWPGVELRQHPSATTEGETDGVEFRLHGRQIGHVHGDCDLHLPFTRALKAHVIAEQLAQVAPFAPDSSWALYAPLTVEDAAHTVWLLRLNYVRLRRQRLTPHAATSSHVLREHEAALSAVSPGIAMLVRRTQARSRPRPLPTPDADQPNA